MTEMKSTVLYRMSKDTEEIFVKNGRTPYEMVFGGMMAGLHMALSNPDYAKLAWEEFLAALPEHEGEESAAEARNWQKLSRFMFIKYPFLDQGSESDVN